MIISINDLSTLYSLVALLFNDVLFPAGDLLLPGERPVAEVDGIGSVAEEEDSRSRRTAT